MRAPVHRLNGPYRSTLWQQGAFGIVGFQKRWRAAGPGKSPFLEPLAGIPILVTPPPVPAPPTTPEEIARVRRRAEGFFERMIQRQDGHLHLERNKNMLSFFKNEPRHVVIAGGTGDGLGFALACALSLILVEGSSLTVIGSDPDNSFNYFTGKIMEETFKNHHFNFRWFDGGFDVRRTGAQKQGLTIANKEIVRHLKQVGAQDIIYINTVFRLHSGLMPNLPTVYVPDLNERGELVQYELQPLTPLQIKENKYIMGNLAVRFPEALRRKGLTLSHEHFIDHRATTFKLIREPESEVYGRWGPIATCLWDPKETIDEYVHRVHGLKRIRKKTVLSKPSSKPSSLLDHLPGSKGMRDIWQRIRQRKKEPESTVIPSGPPIVTKPVLIHELPTAWSSSMRHMPGANLIAKIFEKLVIDKGKQPMTLPLFAIDMLQAIGDSAIGPKRDIRVSYDKEEYKLDEELFAVIANINNDQSPWHYKLWVTL